MRTEKNRSRTTLFTAALAGAATLSAELALDPSIANAAPVTANANFSATVEVAGAFPTTGLGTSFEAAGTTANAFPGFGAVAFNSSSFASLAGTGVLPAATLTASEFISTSTSTMTSAGSVINLYFAEAPSTTTAGLGVYNTSSGPGGFSPSSFNADLVGVATYANVANQVDTIPLTLSTADVTYINSVLAGGSGTFEFFTVATTATTGARYDGNYTPAPATLTLSGATAVPEPTAGLLLGSALAPLAVRRRRRANGSTAR